eukprot:scaffold1355_cov268-Pinguiococcus_pyrenoidosus.AAC.71
MSRLRSSCRRPAESVRRYKRQNSRRASMHHRSATSSSSRAMKASSSASPEYKNATSCRRAREEIPARPIAAGFTEVVLDTPFFVTAPSTRSCASRDQAHSTSECSQSLSSSDTCRQMSARQSEGAVWLRRRKSVQVSASARPLEVWDMLAMLRRPELAMAGARRRLGRKAAEKDRNRGSPAPTGR